MWVIKMKIIEEKAAHKIKYFDLFDFVDKISLTPRVLEHMEYTNKNFDEYFKKLSKLDDKFVLYILASLASEEIKNNQVIENRRIKELDFSIANLFFDSLRISHQRIHDIHKFVMKDEDACDKVGKYRKRPVRISSIEDDCERIYAYTAEPEDVKMFMDKFIDIYKSKSSSVLNNNPFLKSSLMHLLFVKIHPYIDGNGRTARTIHNIKFTESVNKIYDMNLKISPINLSESININKISYAKALNNTYFDLEHDNTEAINFWFDIMLSFYDEQLFRNQFIIDNIDDHVKTILTLKKKLDPIFIDEIERLDDRVKKVIEVKENMTAKKRKKVENMKIRKKTSR